MGDEQAEAGTEPQRLSWLHRTRRIISSPRVYAVVFSVAMLAVGSRLTYEGFVARQAHPDDVRIHANALSEDHDNDVASGELPPMPPLALPSVLPSGTSDYVPGYSRVTLDNANLPVGATENGWVCYQGKHADQDKVTCYVPAPALPAGGQGAVKMLDVTPIAPTKNLHINWSKVFGGIGSFLVALVAALSALGYKPFEHRNKAESQTENNKPASTTA